MIMIIIIELVYCHVVSSMTMTMHTTLSIKGNEHQMNTTLQKADLQLDDYLDLLNLATNLGDTRWQKEIIRKLSYTYPATACKQPQ